MCDCDHYNLVKCHWNANFEEIDTALSRGRNDGFWLWWRIVMKYAKPNINIAVLRKRIL